MGNKLAAWIVNTFFRAHIEAIADERLVARERRFARALRCADDAFKPIFKGRAAAVRALDTAPVNSRSSD